MEQGAHMSRTNDSNSRGVTHPGFKNAPSELVARMRRALTSSFTSLHQPIRATGVSPFTSEATYIAAALEVLEKLLADAYANAPLQIVSVELADMLMQLMATLKTSTPITAWNLRCLATIRLSWLMSRQSPRCYSC